CSRALHAVTRPREFARASYPSSARLAPSLHRIAHSHRVTHLATELGRSLPQPASPPASRDRGPKREPIQGQAREPHRNCEPEWECSPEVDPLPSPQSTPGPA